MKFSMLNISALYLINGSLLGQATFQADFTPHCLAYFCQTCGEIWARVIITGGEATPHWTFETAPCEKHLCSGVTDWKHYPGCLCIESTCTKEHLSGLQNRPQQLHLFIIPLPTQSPPDTQRGRILRCASNLERLCLGEAHAKTCRVAMPAAAVLLCHFGNIRAVVARPQTEYPALRRIPVAGRERPALC